MAPDRKFRYEALGEKTTDGDQEDLRLPSYGFDRSWRNYVFIFLNGLLFTLSVIFFFVSVRIRPTELQCAKMVSPYSPIWDVVEFWEGSPLNFFNHTSQYRGPPSLELETAWDKLWRHKMVPVDRAGLKALNKTGDVKYAQVIGSDPNNPTYGGNLEVFHQIHCLNLIRQATWPLEKFNESWKTYPHDLVEPLARRMHVDHCIEELRQSLMCYSDITPVLVEVDEGRNVPRKSDFNVHRKCRNFEKISSYMEKNELFLPDWQSR